MYLSSQIRKTIFFEDRILLQHVDTLKAMGQSAPYLCCKLTVLSVFLCRERDSLYSETILAVTGFGDIMRMVGTTIVELSDISSGIVLDCTLQETHLSNTLMNDYRTGDFLVLKLGANAISWTGAVTKVIIQPNWRYL